MNTYLLTISMYISLNILFFFAGYVWCKLISAKGNVGVSQNKNPFVSSNKNDDEGLKLAGIDSTKVVVNIKTDGLEKKYESLGEVKTTTDNIAGSVNKLKNLRK